MRQGQRIEERPGRPSEQTGGPNESLGMLLRGGEEVTTTTKSEVTVDGWRKNARSRILGRREKSKGAVLRRRTAHRYRETQEAFAPHSMVQPRAQQEPEARVAFHPRQALPTNNHPSAKHAIPHRHPSLQPPKKKNTNPKHRHYTSPTSHLQVHEEAAVELCLAQLNNCLTSLCVVCEAALPSAALSADCFGSMRRLVKKKKGIPIGVRKRRKRVVNITII